MLKLKNGYDINKALKSKNLNYDEGGCCYGFTAMAINAILCNDVDTFINRFKNGSENKLEQDTFLQNISICQSPEAFKYLSNNFNAQDLESTFKLVQPDKLEKQGGIAKIFTSAGIYSHADLQTYFSCLHNVLKNTVSNEYPLALSLNSHNHTMALTLQQNLNTLENNWLLLEVTLPDVFLCIK